MTCGKAIKLITWDKHISIEGLLLYSKVEGCTLFKWGRQVPAKYMSKKKWIRIKNKNKLKLSFKFKK